MAGPISGRRSSCKGIPRTDPDRRETVLEKKFSEICPRVREVWPVLIPMPSIQAIFHDEGYGAFHEDLRLLDYQLNVDFCRTMLLEDVSIELKQSWYSKMTAHPQCKSEIT